MEYKQCGKRSAFNLRIVDARHEGNEWLAKHIADTNLAESLNLANFSRLASIGNHAALVVHGEFCRR